MARHVLVTEETLSVDRCLEAVRSPSRGGINVFIGQVRNHNRGDDVTHLDYEAFESMVTKVLSEICERIESKHADLEIALEHRIGHVVVGQDAVVIAAAAPHRDEAFKACRFMIEELKKHAPIWKKEHGHDGVIWVGLGP